MKPVFDCLQENIYHLNVQFMRKHWIKFKNIWGENMARNIFMPFVYLNMNKISGVTENKV